jgi:competence protein ComEC
LLLGALALAGCAERDASVLLPDSAPPEISGLVQSGGRVTWQTSEDCDCVLLYGSKLGIYDHYGYSVRDGGRAHEIDLIDIESGRYYFRVVATDQAGNAAASPETSVVLADLPTPDKFVYTMVDVGWGDCHFLEFPNGTRVMIDAGQSSHATDVGAFLNARHVPAPAGVTYMIATHAHADHYGSFRGSLLVLYHDTEFLAPESPSVSVWPYLDEFLLPQQIPTHGLVAGQTNENTDFLKWDEEHGVKVKVLAAGSGRLFTPGVASDSVNCDSAVLKVSFGAVDFLLTGDAEEFTEDLMIKTCGDELACEILKVGHHANDDASSDLFLRRVGARVGLVSNSREENDGVFDQTVIRLLRENGVDYYVTDRVYMNAGRTDQPQHGNVTVTTDGETYVVSSWK